MTIPAPINHAVQKTQEWLKELHANTDLSGEAAALSVLKAVLHHLRDRLTAEEAVDLAAQLPLIVRGIYYEGWRPRHVPQTWRTKEQFLDDLGAAVLPHTFPVERAVRDVFALLAHHCDPGEIADVIDQMPAELKDLWPPHARSFQRREPRAG